MTNTLVIGDLHLFKGQNLGKQGIGTALNSRLIDQIELLDWIFDQALENDVFNIIFTGDIFEEPKPNYTVVSILLEWCKKCADNNIKIHIVAGNHDILRSGQFTTSPLDIINSVEMENIYFYKKVQTIELTGISFTFFPFRDRRSFNTNSNVEAVNILRSQLPYELASINRFSKKVLIGHLSLEGSIPIGYEISDLANELFCPLDMFAGYDYVFMGHVHKFQIMSEKPLIAHIGSLDISNFGEADQKKFIALLSTTNTEFCKYIQVPTRPLKSITIDIPQECEDINKFICSIIKTDYSDLVNAIVRINININDNQVYTIDRSKIEDIVSELGAFHITKISEQRKLAPIVKAASKNIDTTVNEISAINMYSTYIDEDIREQFVQTAKNIIAEYREIKD